MGAMPEDYQWSDTGTITSRSLDSMTDDTKQWRENYWAGAVLEFYDPTTETWSTQNIEVKENTATRLTIRLYGLDPAFDLTTIARVGGKYRVRFDDDTLRGDVDDPDVSHLAAVFDDLYIMVLNLPHTWQSNLEWSHHFEGMRSLGNYTGLKSPDHPNGRDIPWSVPSWWGFRFLGCYELYMGITLAGLGDNDPDVGEQISPYGMMTMGMPRYVEGKPIYERDRTALIPYEILRDMGVEFQWTEDEKKKAAKAAILHEFLHGFGVPDGPDLPEGVQPQNAMDQPKGKLVPSIPPLLNGEQIDRIRKRERIF